MVIRILAIAAMFVTVAPACMAAEQVPRSRLNPASRAEAAKKYPLIVAYTVSWCPHCRAAKEYLVRNNIPFINKDVEKDPKAMEQLTDTYHSQGVPVIVIGTGKDEVVLEGFSPELFEAALKKAQSEK